MRALHGRQHFWCCSRDSVPRCAMVRIALSMEIVIVKRLMLRFQEFEERTERVRKLREEYTAADTGLQVLTAAVEEKKVILSLS